jgi:hypothetical protein
MASSLCVAPLLSRVAGHELLTGPAHLPKVLPEAGSDARVVGDSLLANGEDIISARLLRRDLIDVLLRKRGKRKRHAGKDYYRGYPVHRTFLPRANPPASSTNPRDLGSFLRRQIRPI